jgi:hypothetical protein
MTKPKAKTIQQAHTTTNKELTPKSKDKPGKLTEIFNQKAGTATPDMTGGVINECPPQIVLPEITEKETTDIYYQIVYISLRYNLGCPRCKSSLEFFSHKNFPEKKVRQDAQNK